MIINLQIEPLLGTSVPDMGSELDNNTLGSVLFGKTRRAVLSLMFTHPDRSFYLRQIVRAVNAGSGAVQREINQLTKAGIIQKTKSGNQVYYQIDRNCPIHDELKGLIIKTSAIGDTLRSGISAIKDKIMVAFVFGSAARGDFQSRSDIDLLVIGDVSFEQISTILMPMQDQLKREINPNVYPVSEFKRKLDEGHHFLNSIINEKKFFLIGNENELGRLASK